MVQPPNLDINLLLAFLLLFSLSIGVIYTNKSQGITSNNTPPRSLFSIDEGIELIHPFIISVSIEKIVDLMKQFPYDTSYKITKHIIEDKQSTLNQRDKQQLILGMAQAFPDKLKLKEKFLNLLLTLDEISKGPILLINAVNDGHRTLVPALIAWAKDNQKAHPELKDLATKSLYLAIDNNNVDTLKKLQESGIAIDPKQTSDLLWYVVENNKSADFIPFLVSQGSDLSISKEGHTLVTKAAKSNNLAIIKALVSALETKGTSKQKIADYLNRFVDPMVGSAIQIAIQKDYTKLELYLRQQGAQEK
ncbi:ankyrin repeat domain-containing protein [Candidatus Dependentiae bacterium]|nr:MAG: ankyrin repeat domain-containing protein [Candidatus Dependentiae bacterium]